MFFLRGILAIKKLVGEVLEKMKKLRITHVMRIVSASVLACVLLCDWQRAGYIFIESGTCFIAKNQSSWNIVVLEWKYVFGQSCYVLHHQILRGLSPLKETFGVGDRD